MNWLKRLGQYKEFIAILVFFVGGVGWIYGFFATKQQVVQLRCLLNASITIAHADADLKYMSSRIPDLQVEIDELTNQKAQRALSTSEQKRLSEASTEMSEDQDAMKQDAKLLQDNNQLIQKDGCSSGGSI